MVGRRYIDMQAALALNCGTSIPHSLSESGWDASQVRLCLYFNKISFFSHQIRRSSLPPT